MYWLCLKKKQRLFLYSNLQGHLNLKTRQSTDDNINDCIKQLCYWLWGVLKVCKGKLKFLFLFVFCFFFHILDSIFDANLLQHLSDHRIWSKKKKKVTFSKSPTPPCVSYSAIYTVHEPRFAPGSCISSPPLGWWLTQR